jgi:hypothetical protein
MIENNRYNTLLINILPHATFQYIPIEYSAYAQDLLYFVELKVMMVWKHVGQVGWGFQNERTCSTLWGYLNKQTLSCVSGKKYFQKMYNSDNNIVGRPVVTEEVSAGLFLCEKRHWNYRRQY